MYDIGALPMMQHSIGTYVPVLTEIEMVRQSARLHGDNSVLSSACLRSLPESDVFPLNNPQ